MLTSIVFNNDGELQVAAVSHATHADEADHATTSDSATTAAIGTTTPAAGTGTHALDRSASND